MPLKKAVGNMYDWVDYTHCHLGGECPHKCVYCYVDNPRFGRAPRYTGEVRLLKEEFLVNYGEKRTIFVEHMNDIAAIGVPDNYIEIIMNHVNEWPDNTYVFQSKNPGRLLDFMEWFPPSFIVGTTIESNRDLSKISQAPHPMDRAKAMELFGDYETERFVTIEPILRFDHGAFVRMLRDIEPDFINIGADSKNHGLEEPTKEDVLRLAQSLIDMGFEVRKKLNLERLVG